jgi:hypothetical protein
VLHEVCSRDCSRPVQRRGGKRPTTTPSCKAQAAEKKLAGAAQKSFMTRCENDAKAACNKSAADKKLAGAAKDSHIKKCMSDSVGG